ncbi:MAG TPA: FAD-binding oxidoreductase [Roseiflexaceae bacterium]|nr:FAD-binding oxidoreductase [Roseiflexaceae bacterium]
MTLPNHAQVVIIGAGMMGASIAYHLSERGCSDIVILEQQEIEVAGSTARAVAGVRHQFSTEVNIRLSQYGIERLHHFGEEVGADPGFHQIGYLFLIDNADDWTTYQQSVMLQKRLGVPVELLTPEQAARFVPDTNTAGLLGATYCAADGYCDPHSIAMAYLARARERGARLLRSTPATGIRSENGSVVAVETPRGPVGCDYVVNAAGSWAGAVGALAGLDVPVQPFRRCVYVTEPFAAIQGDIPLTIDVGSGFYMRKEGQSVIFGLSNPDEPPGYNLQVDWDWLDSVLEAGFRRFPILERAGLAEKQCWAGAYEITPDHHPILGRHPQLPNYVDASGFSGHGIMHGPATGLLIAEEILDGRAHTINIDDLRIERFLTGRAGHERNII